MKKQTNEEIIDTFSTFPKDKFSLMLSTTSKDIEPLTSYSPFVEDDNKFYVVMSSSLPHYKNIEATLKAHAFIIEDEKDASHIYARKRLYFSATCRIVNDEKYFELFDKRYGESLSFIRKMKDFVIVELTPKEKSLVLGFGAAYLMNENGELIEKNISHK
jgi:putative heme iron utilization protein